MPKFMVLVVLVPIFFACAQTPQTASSKTTPGTTSRTAHKDNSLDFWDTTPRGNQLVFHGVSGRLMNHDEEIKLAKEDAARRIAMFNSIRGEYTRSESIGGGLLDYNSTLECRLYFNENYKKLAEEVDFDPETDVLVTAQAVFVRVRYTPPSPIRFTHKLTRMDKPEWVHNPPARISGFVAGVGHANPRLYHKDTVIASYENAVYAIVGNVNNSVKGSSHNRKSTEGSYNDFDAGTEHSSSAKAELEGFYILEIWIDPANQGVYTLAIANHKN